MNEINIQFNFKGKGNIRLPYSYVSAQREVINCDKLIRDYPEGCFIVASHIFSKTKLVFENEHRYEALIFDRNKMHIGTFAFSQLNMEDSRCNLVGEFFIITPSVYYLGFRLIKSFNIYTKKKFKIKLKVLREKWSFWHLFTWRKIYVDQKRFVKIEKDRLALFKNNRGFPSPPIQSIPNFCNGNKFIAMSDQNGRNIKYYLLSPEYDYIPKLVDTDVNRVLDPSLVGTGIGITRGVDRFEENSK